MSGPNTSKSWHINNSNQIIFNHGGVFNFTLYYKGRQVDDRTLAPNLKAEIVSFLVKDLMDQDIFDWFPSEVGKNSSGGRSSQKNSGSQPILSEDQINLDIRFCENSAASVSVRSKYHSYVRKYTLPKETLAEAANLPKKKRLKELVNKIKSKRWFEKTFASGVNRNHLVFSHTKIDHVDQLHKISQKDEELNREIKKFQDDRINKKSINSWTEAMNQKDPRCFFSTKFGKQMSDLLKKKKKLDKVLIQTLQKQLPKGKDRFFFPIELKGVWICIEYRTHSKELITYVPSTEDLPPKSTKPLKTAVAQFFKPSKQSTVAIPYYGQSSSPAVCLSTIDLVRRGKQLTNSPPPKLGRIAGFFKSLEEVGKILIPGSTNSTPPERMWKINEETLPIFRSEMAYLITSKKSVKA